MSRHRPRARRSLPAPRLLALLAIGLGLLAPLAVGSGPRAAADGASDEAPPQTDDSVPAGEVTMIGATPQEAGAGQGETSGATAPARSWSATRSAPKTSVSGRSGRRFAAPRVNR